MMMRTSLVALVLIVTSACSFERSPTAPQPQKSALSQCYTNGCAKPLFVVDGKRLADDSIDLNPGDILTVEVFKGDLAMAQYGAEARNGVVVITTKRATLQK
jgi:TonB-dependent SusC/RagA subfamily outer membrane receptor